MSSVVRNGRFELVRLVLCVIVIAIAVIALMGWAFGISALKSVLPGLTTVKANTAVGLLAAGLALLLIGRTPTSNFGRFFPIFLGGLVAVLGALTMVEYSTHFSFGIDELLFSDPSTTSKPYPGRMSPATAVAFVALGVSVVLLAASDAVRVIFAAHVFAAVPAAVGYLSLAGYAYNVESLYNFGPFVSVAILTGVGMALLSTALLLTKANYGWGHGYRDRPIALGILLRLLTLALVVPFAAGLLIVVGVRIGLYQPLFGPALFAVVAALAFGVLAVQTAGTVRRGEEALLTAREDIRRQENLAAATARDISERRRIETVKDQFLATVSHELRTPLTSIAGSLGLLKGGAGGQLPTRAVRLVEIAEANSARLVRLINDILDMEKIRAGSVVFHKQPLQIQTLVAMALDAMSGLASDRGVILGADEIDPALVAMVDQDWMMQVLSNLLSNAIKVSSAGCSVHISAEAHRGYGRILVVDHGSGVPAEFQHRIFERFAQADGSDGRNLGGTGLGLSIVKEIVERHGGTVGFKSKAGEGATFFFDLPLVEAPEVNSDLTLKIPRILICEDDELISEVLSGEIEDLGYRVEVVSTANEARHVLHTGRFGALLLDMRLPDSDGVTLMRALRSAPSTTTLPIIAISGSGELRAEAEGLGIVDWLGKPVAMDRLKDALEIALGLVEGVSPVILHVDGDLHLLELAAGRLGGLGEIIMANSLKAARTVLAQTRLDLVIMEIDLPDGSGELLLDDLRHLNACSPPVILYTAKDIVAPLRPPIGAVLIKSQSDLPALAKAAKRLLEGALNGDAQAAVR